MITFLLIRHGQSASNAAATLTGQIDIPLTEVGLKQGELASQYVYENYKVDAIYSSDLSRAYATALPLSKLTGVPIVKNKNFREMHCGNWQGEKVENLVKSDLYQRWKNHDRNAYPPNGESFLQAQERAVKEIEKISSVSDGKTVVIVAHGGVIKVLTAFVLNIPIEEWSEKLPYVSNASVTKVIYENGKYTLIDTVDSYLGEMKTEMPRGI